MHIVLVAWIAVVELQLSSSQYGWVQAASLLPNLFLMLVAGAWADRYDPAKVVAAAQMLITFSYFALLVMLESETGSFHWMLFYALCVGVGNAFVQPVREKLVAEIQNQTIQRRISLLSITQFSLQSGGIALAALAESLGLVFVLAVQIGLSFFSSLIFMSLKKSPHPASGAVVSTWSDIRGALVFAWASPGLRQLMALIAFNGYMHMGVFLVLIPVIATRVYALSSSEYAGLQLVFVLGMIGAHVRILQQKTLEFPGQGALFCLLYTALIGFGLARGPTLVGFFILVFMWGFVAGSSAGRCRLVLQSLVDPAMNGRMMALYQMTLFGSAPGGALVTGYVMDYLDADEIFLFMSVSSIVLFVLFLMSKTLWSLKRIDLQNDNC